MGLENVVQAVQERGRSEAEAVLAESRKEADRILAEARSDVEQARVEAEGRARDLAARRRAQELSRAELDARRLVLAAQKAQLDEVYRRGQERLTSLPGNDDLLQKLLKSNEGVWKEGGRVYAAAKDAAAVKAVAGKAYAGPVEALGGVIVENEDGTLRMDLRYESILRDVWQNAMKEVAEILWPSRAPRS